MDWCEDVSSFQEGELVVGEDFSRDQTVGDHVVDCFRNKAID